MYAAWRHIQLIPNHVDAARLHMAALNILTHSQGNQRPRTPYENTFKMKPDLKVNAAAIEKIIANVLKVQLEEEKYDPKATKQVVSINCAKNLLLMYFVF